MIIKNDPQKVVDLSFVEFSCRPDITNRVKGGIFPVFCFGPDDDYMSMWVDSR